MKHSLFLILLSLIFATSCKKETSENTAMNIIAPKAQKIEKHLEIHGDVRIDPYYWLNEREHEEVIDYLERENDYFEKMTAHTKDFQQSLFEEMKARIKEDDSSVPYFYNGYYYITRYEKGKDYPIFTRKKERLDAEEEILFDCNVMAMGHDYFHLNGISVSPDNTKVAFGIDTVGRRLYTLQIKDLKTGKIYSEKIELTTGGSTWANDSETIFYPIKDPQTLRLNKIYRHQLGRDVETDQLVYHEEDETFSVFVYKTKSNKYLVAGSYSTLTTEYHILDANLPNESFRVFTPRKRGVEYSIYHYANSFYILTNKDAATNFKLMKTHEDNTAPSNWEEVIPHREDVLLEDVEIFKDYLVVSERNNGLNKIFISRWDGTDAYYLPFDNETYMAYPSQNHEFDTDTLRYTYNS